MTTPTGHGGDINLAALWVPVMPETSHMGEKMHEAGREAKQKFEQGFNTGTSPEALGQSYGSKLSASLASSFGNLNLPILGNVGKTLDSLGGDIDRNLVAKLRGEATTALQNYRTEWGNLQAAQQRSSQLEEEITRRREAGLGAHSIIPLMSQQAQATRDVEAATKSATGAHDMYIAKTTRLTEVQGAAADSGKVLAGMMGGLIVAGAQMAAQGLTTVIETVVHGMVEGFRLGIDVTKELAERAIELGETYEHIGIQIHEFSSASGEDFTRMEESAQRVFSTLDVAGNNTGQTMAVLGSRLNLTGPALETLTRHVEELQGRFGNLNVEKLAVGFSALGVTGSNADQVMASWLNTSRSLGLSFGDLTSTISTMADQLRPDVTGLTPEQLGRWVGEIESKIPNAQRALMGLSGAEKYFAQQHLTFAEGLKEAATEINSASSEADKQQLAETLFGTRKWADALTMIQQYQDVVNQGPAAFQANSASLEQFLSSTETLGNKWELVKHRIEDAFKPLGDAALKAVGAGLDAAMRFVNTHMDQIKHAIAEAGIYIIHWAGQLQTFVEALLDFFGPIVNAIDSTIAAAIGGLGAFSHVAGEVLSNIPGFKDMGNGLLNAGKSAEGFAINLNKLNVGDKMHELADWSRQHHIDVDTASQSWVKFWQEASGEKADLSKLDSFKGSWWDSGNTAGIPTPPTAPGGPLAGQPPGMFGFGPSPGPGAPAAPSAPAPAPGQPGLPGRRIPTPGIGGRMGNQAPFAAASSGDPDSNRALAQQLFGQYFPESEWGAFDWLVGKESHYDTHATSPAGAYGIGQFMPATFTQYGGRTDDPGRQLVMMFQYIRDRYGTPSAAVAQYYNHPRGEGSYATGGVAGLHPGKPRGSDVVPAWLTPGERIFDVEKSQRFSALFDAIQAGHFDVGGIIPVKDPRGSEGSNPNQTPTGPGPFGPMWDDSSEWSHHALRPSLSPDDPGKYWFEGPSPARGWIRGRWPALGPQRPDLTRPRGPGDPSHWSDDKIHYFDTGTRDAGHSGQSGVLQVIFSNLDTGQKTGEAGGQFVGPGTTQAQYYSADWGGHTGHVHTSFATGPDGQPYGLPRGTDIRQGGPGFPPWVYAIGAQFGLEASTYPGHQESSGYNRGIDWWPKGHYDMSGASYTRDERARLQNFATTISSLGVGVSTASARGADGPAAWGDPTGATPPGRNTAGYPGMPGQYSGTGLYGGETADQAFQAQRAVDNANNRLTDINTEIDKKQKERDKIAADLAAAQAQPQLTRKQSEIDAKTAQLAALDEELNKYKTRELPMAQQDIDEAKRKQGEAALKPPPGTTTGTSQRAAPGASAAQQLGSSFLKGIGQELGFGDIFSKSPLDWGIVKLATGLANWGIGTANAWADEIGKGHTGVTGNQPIPGWDTQQGGQSVTGGLLGGLSSSLGVNLPKTLLPQNNVSTGPNVVPAQSLPGPFGPPTGPPPGPVINGDFMPINVSPNVDPSAVLGPVQEQRNSDNSRLHGQTGGLPQT